jgi:Lysine biosynthesis enzyme LysX
VATFSLVYDVLRWEEKEIIKEAKQKGVAVDLINIKKIYFKIDPSLENKFLNELILQRCASSIRRIYSTAILEQGGAKVVNSFNTCLISSNKLLTNLALLKKGLPTPLAYASFSEEACLESSTHLNYPLVFKPVVGSWGRLVLRVKDSEELKNLLEYRNYINSMYKEIYYLQEFINKPSRDIRCIIVGDEVVALTYRYQAEKDFRTNVAIGGKVSEAKLNEEQIELFFKAKEAVEGEIVGIDAMEKQDQILIHEVNSSVEFKGAYQVFGRKIVEKIVDYMVKLAKK